MIIATHCGDVDGFRWTYEFTDSEGIDRTLVVDIAVGVGRTNDANMLRVTQFIRFISLDGVDWHDPKKKGTLYVGKAILDYLEMTGSSTAPMKPTKKETVPRVVGSSALTRGRPHRAMPERFKVPNVSIHRWSGQSVPSLSELRRDTLSSPRVIGGFTAASAFSRETAAGAKLPLSDKVTPKREDTGFCRPKRKAVVRFNEQDHARHDRPIRRHTALEQPFEIVVRYPHHPFAGKRITVVRCRTYAHQSHFVIDAPDNYRILLPAWMTEPWAATLPLLEVPRLSIDALRALSRLIDAHRSSSSSATSRIDGGDHEPTSPVVPTRSACAGRGQTSNKTNQSSIANRSRKPSQASRQRVRRSRSGRKGRKQ